MAKSLVWRWLIIVVVLASWTYSLFPPTDRDFYQAMTAAAEGGDKGADEAFTKMIAAARQIEQASLAATNDSFKKSPLKAVEEAADAAGIRLNEYIVIHGQPTASNRSVLQYVRRISRGKLRLGLDLRGGTEFVIAIDEAKIPKDRTLTELRDQIMEIVRNRIDQSGVLEPEILPVGENSISIRIPATDLDDKQRFKEILSQTANLKFHLVHPKNDELVSDEAQKRLQDPSFVLTVPDYTRKVLEEERNGQPASSILFIKTQPEEVDGSHLSRAGASMDEFGSFIVNLEFNLKGAELFGRTTTDHVGERLAIVLDGTVKSAPNLNEPILGGRAQISGSFTREEAHQLGIVLQCGNLPVDIKIDSEQFISPTLGLESIKSSAWAGGAGLLAVMLFMMIYYMVPGVIANIALLLNVVLIFGTMPLLDATLTLPGLAGIILTIGMAVDANVLIFERIREELLAGKSTENAVKRGFAQAFWTIFDSNITTLFAAIILMNFGSGTIKGFGVTLTIGIASSMFTALFVTRAIFDVLLHFNLLRKIYMIQAFQIRTIRFLDFSKPFIYVSLALIAISLVVGIARGRNALSVDFRGGTALSYTYVDGPDAEALVKALEAHPDLNLKEPRAHYKASATSNAKLVEIVVSNTFEAEDHIAAKVQDALNQQFPDAKFDSGLETAVGALVGKQFIAQALKALFWSLVCMLIYVSFRFEFGFALGAVVALLHDSVIATGLFLLASGMERQISLTAIAAILTIVGFSINDTIVIFDRIRENLGLMKKSDFREICNVSISQTLSRTIITNGTVLAVIITLFIFGGGPVNDFALIMLIGVVAGTYSTIFIATPVMLWWLERQAKKKGTSVLHEAAGRQPTTTQQPDVGAPA
jgi:SecD/SecF fusion protein